MILFNLCLKKKIKKNSSYDVYFCRILCDIKNLIFISKIYFDDYFVG